LQRSCGRTLLHNFPPFKHRNRGCESHLVLGCFTVSVFSCVSRGLEMHRPAIQAVYPMPTLFQKVFLNWNRKYRWRIIKHTAIRLHLKCDGTRADTRSGLSAKRTSPFKSAGASVQSTPGSRGVRISGSNLGYTMFRGSVKGTGYPLHSPVSPSLLLPCVTVCHHISTGLYDCS
jgi:hypothetical protein